MLVKKTFNDITFNVLISNPRLACNVITFNTLFEELTKDTFFFIRETWSYEATEYKQLYITAMGFENMVSIVTSEYLHKKPK